MRGYKVVRRGMNGWESCAIARPGGGVTYRVKRTTRRPKNGGPLCVFSSKKSALRMANDFLFFEPLRVFSCEYVPSLDRNIWTPGKPEVSVYWLYPSTHLADSVKLIERVK